MLKHFAAAALALFTAPALAQEANVRIGIARGIGTATTMIAIEKGYFREQGIKVTAEELESAANVMTLLAQGALQVVEGGITVGYFNAIERGLPLAIVADRVSTPLNQIGRAHV